jgi:hypothetical protein
LAWRRERGLNKIAALCRMKRAQSREITALISRRTILGLKAARKLAFLLADNLSSQNPPARGTFPKVR